MFGEDIDGDKKGQFLSFVEIFMAMVISCVSSIITYMRCYWIRNSTTCQGVQQFFDTTFYQSVPVN